MCNLFRKKTSQWSQLWCSESNLYRQIFWCLRLLMRVGFWVRGWVIMFVLFDLFHSTKNNTPLTLQTKNILISQNPWTIKTQVKCDTDNEGSLLLIFTCECFIAYLCKWLAWIGMKNVLSLLNVKSSTKMKIILELCIDYF